MEGDRAGDAATTDCDGGRRGHCGVCGERSDAHADGVAVDVARLTAIEGVQSHRVDAGLHQLSVSELHRRCRASLPRSSEQGLHLSEFRTHSATLEDVFVRLTGRNLRDE
jgi:ABC-2 type transport system ATP-binding protein